MNDPWITRIQAISSAVIAVLAAVGVLLGAWNNSKLSTVQEHQQVNTQKIDEAKVAATEAKHTADETKRTVEETKKTVESTAVRMGKQ